MNRRRVTVAVAAAGVVAGVTGLGVLAMPAGAGPAPVLPDVTAESLVESVITAKPAAFGGSVEVNNDLGVPALAGMPQLSDGASSLRMWTDGTGKVRVQLPAGESEKTFVDDGRTSWLWDSAEQTVRKVPRDAAAERGHVEGAPSDPVTLAREVVTRVQEFSDVTVDGTARVAGRAAYELVLTPKPTERTVLREVRVAVDAELRAPLRVSVLTNGTNAPAAQVGFSELNVGPQDPALFAFTPPAGAEVSEVRPQDLSEEDRTAAERLLAEANPQVVGEGWDAVLVARVPADALADLEPRPTGDGGEWEGRRGEEGVDVQGLLRQLGKQVSGPWGSGTLVTARVGGVLIADDGRVAVGAVPEQVLVEAIGQVK
ncbi:outer membrane lipoprotein carrier protein LolA [Actinosynnema sp. NPDC059797]